MANKDVQNLLRRLRRAGWVVEQSRKNYYYVTSPVDGETVRIPSTPSGSRTIRNVRAELKRHGFDG